MSSSNETVSPLRVLFFGATGRIGFNLLKLGLLSEKYSSKFKVTIGTRASTVSSEDSDKKNKVADLKSLGANFIDLDLNSASHSALVSAIKQHDILMLITAYNIPLPKLLALVSAAKEAGNLKLFVPSEFGFLYDQFAQPISISDVDRKVKLAEALRTSGVPYARIITGIYYQYVLGPFGGIDLAKRSITIPGSPATQITVMRELDGAQLTAEILLNYSADYVRNQTILLGAETVSWKSVTQLLEAKTGSEWSKQVRTVNELSQIVTESEKAAAGSVNAPIETAILERWHLLMAEGKGCFWNVNDEQTSFIHLHSKSHAGFNIKLQTMSEYIAQLNF